MKNLNDLDLTPGETVFVDGVSDGVARLLIGEAGERMETVPADQLPEEGRKEGTALRVQKDGKLDVDIDPKLKTALSEMDALMKEVFGEPPPSEES
jgi:hypothetical protein